MKQCAKRGGTPRIGGRWDDWQCSDEATTLVVTPANDEHDPYPWPEKREEFCTFHAYEEVATYGRLRGTHFAEG